MLSSSRATRLSGRTWGRMSVPPLFFSGHWAGRNRFVYEGCDCMLRAGSGRQAARDSSFDRTASERHVRRPRLQDHVKRSSAKYLSGSACNHHACGTARTARPPAAVCGKRGRNRSTQAAHARNHARNDRRGERVYGAQAHPTGQYLLDIIMGTHAHPRLRL